jgi:hypothetical protein
MVLGNSRIYNIMLLVVHTWCRSNVLLRIARSNDQAASCQGALPGFKFMRSSGNNSMVKWKDRNQKIFPFIVIDEPLLFSNSAILFS